MPIVRLSTEIKRTKFARTLSFPNSTRPSLHQTSSHLLPAQQPQQPSLNNAPIPLLSNLLLHLLLSNVLLYLEAGAVPALLVTLAEEFGMDQSQQGFMGGVVYLALSVGGPVAGVLLKKYNPRVIIGLSLILNNFAMLVFALTPPGYPSLLILWRGLVGFTQVTVCIYSPLWTDSNAPPSQRASWMASLQAAVPLGVMAGYIAATVAVYVESYVEGEGREVWVAAWRVPFLLQVSVLCGCD